MRKFKPSTPYTTAMRLIKPTETVVKGVTQKAYPENIESCPLFYGTFRTYGGTDTWSNDVYTIVDTAKVETWFNPEITSECMIYVCQTGEYYEIIASPENVDMRNQYMRFKVEKGGGKP